MPYCNQLIHILQPLFKIRNHKTWLRRNGKRARQRVSSKNDHCHAGAGQLPPPARPYTHTHTRTAHMHPNESIVFRPAKVCAIWGYDRISGNHTCLGPRRLGSTMASSVSSRHAGGTVVLPNLCVQAPYRHDSGLKPFFFPPHMAVCVCQLCVHDVV